MKNALDFSNVKAAKIRGNGLDELFGVSSDSRDAIQQKVMLPINQLIAYPNQPFKSYLPDALYDMAESIKKHGIINAVTVRPYNGKYQILSGHNRISAAKLLGLTEAPCEILEDCDDNKAVLLLVDSNMNQRRKLLHSEKAYAFKMEADALAKSGAHNVRTTSELAVRYGESIRSIQYYIRLTYLIKPLLDMVDSDKIPIRAGANLSYIEQDRQSLLFSFMEENAIAAVSVKQSEIIRYAPELAKTFLEETFNLISHVKTPFVHIGTKSKRVLKSYFHKSNYTDEEIAKILDEALKLFFN